MFYWTIREFNSYANMERFIEQNHHKYQMRQVFTNNKWAVEYKDLSRLM